MNIPPVYKSEYQLCLLVWEYKPIRSTELLRLCQRTLHWSKSTTYTVIRRLSEKGILKNKQTIIQSLIPKEKIQDTLLEEYIGTYFECSTYDLSAALSRIKKAAC